MRVQASAGSSVMPDTTENLTDCLLATNYLLLKLLTSGFLPLVQSPCGPEDQGPKEMILTN